MCHSSRVFFRDVLKRNYELEQAKYVLNGKAVRENPLRDLIEGGDDNLGGGSNNLGGFGSQQALQLGKAAKNNNGGAADDEEFDEEGNPIEKK